MEYNDLDDDEVNMLFLALVLNENTALKLLFGTSDFRFPSAINLTMR